MVVTTSLEQSPTETLRGTPRILVADDDPTMRYLYRQALEGAGFKVIEAEDGAVALDAFACSRPDLVLLDVMMPVLDGFATCAALRPSNAGPSAPVLMATQLDDISSIERAFDVGATDFISKPVNWKILVQRLRYMLRADDTLRRLQDSERRLAEAQKIASLGNFVWRVGASALEGSEELQRIFGAISNSGALTLRSLLRQLPGSERASLLEAVRTALDNGTRLRRDLLLDASRKSIEIRGEVIVDAAGRTTIQGTVQDVSDRKRTETALVAARRAAESADAVKSALLAGMNHELRTPLNAIIGFSEIISGEILGPVGERRYKEFATDILQSGRHMLELVSSVLDMAKLASDHYELALEPVDLRAIANQAVATFSDAPLAQARDIALRNWDLPTFANIDSRAVKQMLVHLLSNAVKFSAAEMPVDIICEERGSGELAVSIRDRGIGMSSKEIAAAVEPFCQIDNRLARKYEGLGIGLSIVKKLIEAHGGRLEIDSKAGEGTRASLVFPKNLVLTEERLVETATRTGSDA